MTAVQSGPPASPPEGRYGKGDRRFDRDADAAADRTLRRVAIVLGVLLAAGIGWLGWRSVTSHPVSAQVVAFKTVSDQAVEIHLEVHKPAGKAVVCTLRSQGSDHDEVGRKDVRLTQHAGQVDTVVTVRTTARGTTGELVGCSEAGAAHGG